MYLCIYTYYIYIYTYIYTLMHTHINIHTYIRAYARLMTWDQSCAGPQEDDAWASSELWEGRSEESKEIQKLGVLFVGVRVIRALLFGVYIGTP